MRAPLAERQGVFNTEIFCEEFENGVGDAPSVN
jgi:hypothetical protein